MRRVSETRLWLVYIILLGFLSVAYRAPAQTDDDSVVQKAIMEFEHSALRVSSLGAGISVFSGDGGNVVAIRGTNDTLLIDSGIASRTSELFDAVQKSTERPITRLVNTHWHFDRTGGNSFFGAAGVAIIAQENVTKRLSSAQSVPFTGLRDGPYPPVALPTQTYSTSLTIHQGSEDLKLVNYGPAHTDGDTIVFAVPANIVVMGDIYSNAFYPVIDLGSGGSIDGIIYSVNQVLNRTNERTAFIPGHGPIASRADLQAYGNMLVQVRDRVQRQLTAGQPMDKVVAARPTAEFDAQWATGYVTGKVFTEMVYSSLAAAKRAQ